LNFSTYCLIYYFLNKIKVKVIKRLLITKINVTVALIKRRKKL